MTHREDEKGRLWAFNRRTVEDQVIYVRAETLDEAWTKARADDAEDTSDSAIRSRAYRRLPEDDPRP